MKRAHLIGFFIMTCACVFSQRQTKKDWVQLMQDPNADFVETQKAFEESFAGMTEEQKMNAKGYKPFKRWEWFTQSRLLPNGKPAALADVWNETQSTNASRSSSSPSGNWSYLGPMQMPSSTSYPYYTGAGRVNCIAVAPNDPNTIFVGTPGGGIWKTTDGGATWAMWNTDNLAILGISDIAIDPNNPQVMYITTGDFDGSRMYTIGVLKSTDGGLTWNTTGLSFAQTQTKKLKKILIDPTNTQVLHVIGFDGVWKSTDAGNTFVQTLSIIGTTDDIEFKPGDPSVIYVSQFNKIYKSTNSGASYVSTYTFTGAAKLDIGVTPANPSIVYINAANAGTWDLNGIYRSMNEAGTFSLMANSPDILFGQAWYDLAFAVSPADPNLLMSGGVSPFRSADAGVTWTLASAPGSYIHPDIHDLFFYNDSVMYVASDGGICRSVNKGAFWTDISQGLYIAEIYALGHSASSPNLMLHGWQDNGTTRMNGTTWDRMYGADGAQCFIDNTNNNAMYMSTQNGGLRRSLNGGNNWAGITSGLPLPGNWITPWQQDPVVPTTLWAGYTQVFKSTNQGTNWTQMGTIPGSGNMFALKVAPSNNQVIYAGRMNLLYTSVDGGNNWTNITSGLPTTSSYRISYIEVEPNNPQHLWVTLTGFGANIKVFESTDGGATWNNFSNGLPNVPTNCIVYENGSNDRLYVGTDLGVYYRDAAMSSWAFFSTGLPNVIVSELEIQYGIGKIRAATFGRGLWESDLYSPSTAALTTNTNVALNVRVFPNPNEGSFNISGVPAASTIEVCDVLGKKFLKTASPSDRNTVELNLKHLDKGVYLISVKKGAASSTTKVIIE